MARSPVKKQPAEPDPADLALLEELHAELGERDATIDRLTRVLQRKQDERDLLHSNFSQLVLQVQALRGQVAERLGVELPEAAGAPADVAPPEPQKSEAAEPPRPPALDELKAWADERLSAARQLSPAALGGELKAWATELGTKMEAKIDEIRRKESKS